MKMMHPEMLTPVLSMELCRRKALQSMNPSCSDLWWGSAGGGVLLFFRRCLRSSFPASPFELLAGLWLVGWRNIPSLSPSTLTMPSPISISIPLCPWQSLASTFSNLMLDRILSCISCWPMAISGPPPQLPSESWRSSSEWGWLLMEPGVDDPGWDLSQNSWSPKTIGFLVGVDDVSETQGVNGAVRSEWGVEGALSDSQSSSFFFLRFLFFLPFSSGIMLEYSWISDGPGPGKFGGKGMGPSIGNWCPWVGFWGTMFGPGYLWGLACAWTKLGPWCARFSETNPGPISRGNGPLPIIGLDGLPTNPGCMPCCCGNGGTCICCCILGGCMKSCGSSWL